MIYMIFKHDPSYLSGRNITEDELVCVCNIHDAKMKTNQNEIKLTL
jgi:hypothetical protein